MYLVHIQMYLVDIQMYLVDIQMYLVDIQMYLRTIRIFHIRPLYSIVANAFEHAYTVRICLPLCIARSTTIDTENYRRVVVHAHIHHCICQQLYSGHTNVFARDILRICFSLCSVHLLCTL